MSSKRLAGELMLVAAAVILGSGTAKAQRIGFETRPQTTTTVITSGSPVAQPVAVTFVPVVLMSDGSVFANFGFGWEPVARPCAATVVVGEPTVIASNGHVLSRPQQ